MKGMRWVQGLTPGRVGIAVLAVTLGSLGTAHAVGFSVQADGCTGVQFDQATSTVVLTGCSAAGGGSTPTPTPPPNVTPTPTPRPTPVSGECPDGVLDRPVPGGGGLFGIEDTTVAPGQTRVYCAPLQFGARVVRFYIYKQCLGANFRIRIIPETPFYSDGKTAMKVVDNTSGGNYGNYKKPKGWIPPQTFVVEVAGQAVGDNCPNGKSSYDLFWTFLE